MNRIEAVIGGMKMTRKLTWPEAKAQGERDERARIRKAQRAAIKELRGTLAQTQGICAGTIERAINELDAATKARGNDDVSAVHERRDAESQRTLPVVLSHFASPESGGAVAVAAFDKLMDMVDAIRARVATADANCAPVSQSDRLVVELVTQRDRSEAALRKLLADVQEARTWRAETMRSTLPSSRPTLRNMRKTVLGYLERLAREGLGEP